MECGVKPDGGNSSTTNTSHADSTLEQKSIENSNTFDSAYAENGLPESDKSGGYKDSEKEENFTLHTSNFTLIPHSTLEKSYFSRSFIALSMSRFADFSAISARLS